MIPSGLTFLTPFPSRSAIYVLPRLSIQTARGPIIDASVAGRPSPFLSFSPFPAKVLIIPVLRSNRLILWSCMSAINRPPFLSKKQSFGSFICACVPGPPSPLYPETPVPATVVIIPELWSTFLIAALYLSTIYISPLVSTDSEYKLSMVDRVAGPPSPEYPDTPVPATVVINQVSLSIRRTVWFRPSHIYKLLSVSKAHP